MDVDIIYCIIIGILGIVLFLYSIFEFHYFLRICLTVCVARMWKKTQNVLDETKIFGEYIINGEIRENIFM